MMGLASAVRQLHFHGHEVQSKKQKLVSLRLISHGNINSVLVFIFFYISCHFMCCMTMHTALSSSTPRPEQIRVANVKNGRTKLKNVWILTVVASNRLLKLFKKKLIITLCDAGKMPCNLISNESEPKKKMEKMRKIPK